MRGKLRCCKRVVMVDGEPVGDVLVAEGLACWYGGGRQSWC
ncbi:hypothetical protein [Sphingomicrobium flavum]|nr:hypothetical protein [Sphingomicrobium flavum]